MEKRKQEEIVDLSLNTKNRAGGVARRKGIHEPEKVRLQVEFEDCAVDFKVHALSLQTSRPGRRMVPLGLAQADGNEEARMRC